MTNNTTCNLFFKDRLGRYRTNSSVSKQDIIDFASKLLIPDFIGNTVINNPKKCWNFLKFHITDNSKEHFAVIYLTSKSQVISFEIIATGSIDYVSIAPRSIVQQVIKHSAARVILAHNHPSGHLVPSVNDKTVTEKISKALKLIDVTVDDHLIVCADSYYSFAEHGLTYTV